MLGLGLHVSAWTAESVAAVDSWRRRSNFYYEGSQATRGCSSLSSAGNPFVFEVLGLEYQRPSRDRGRSAKLELW
jgi:hypothetical protein